MRSIAISTFVVATLAVSGQSNAQTVLVYEVENDLAATAADDLGMAVTAVGSEADFVAEFDSGTWDVVIAATPTDGFGTDTFLRIAERADDGLPLIWSYWATDLEPALLAAFEVSASSIFEPPVVVSEPGAPVDFLATIGGVLETSDSTWGDNGDHWTLLGGGFFAATADPGGEGVIAVTNGESSVLNGFLFDNYRTVDNDGDGINDMVEVIQEELIYLTTPRSLTITGVCPGPVTILGTGFTPGASIAVYRGVGFGSDAIGGGPCAGTASAFFGLQAFHGTVVADASGTVSLSPSVPGSACGSALQLQDLGTCVLTNQAAFP